VHVTLTREYEGVGLEVEADHVDAAKNYGKANLDLDRDPIQEIKMTMSGSVSQYKTALICQYPDLWTEGNDDVLGAGPDIDQAPPV